MCANHPIAVECAANECNNNNSSQFYGMVRTFLDEVVYAVSDALNCQNAVEAEKTSSSNDDGGTRELCALNVEITEKLSFVLGAQNDSEKQAEIVEAFVDVDTAISTYYQWAKSTVEGRMSAQEVAQIRQRVEVHSGSSSYSQMFKYSKRLNEEKRKRLEQIHGGGKSALLNDGIVVYDAGMRADRPLLKLTLESMLVSGEGREKMAQKSRGNF